MARTYVKTKRAELEAETRQRLVEAAVELHGEVGPVATTISMIAERAGVQRHTVYAHFPDQRALLMACSGLHLEQLPPPVPAQWEHLSDPAARIAHGLAALYAWFGQDQQMLGNVLRDAEQDPLVREISDLRYGPAYAAIEASLASGLGSGGRAMVGVAMSFHTWRTLTHERKLKPRDAVALMVRAILGADDPAR